MGPVTAEQATQCTVVVPQVFSPRDGFVVEVCGAEALWLDERGEPCCDAHATGHCRRIGVVEGEED